MLIQDLPFPRHIGLKHIKEHTLTKTLICEQWYIPKGTTIKIFQSTNFGFVIIPEGTKDERGFIMQRRIFRF